MARKVTITPLLPRPPAADIFQVSAFQNDLIKALYRVIGEQAQTINELINEVNDHEARITVLEP